MAGKSSGRSGMERGTPKLRNAGGYVPGGRDQGFSGGPRMVDTSGPSDKTTQDASDFKAPKMNVESFKSSENQKNTSLAGVRDTGSGPVPELRRTSPETGTYQSGNNDRGGSATKSYDSTTDNDLNITWDGMEELRAHQDAAANRRKDD